MEIENGMYVAVKTNRGIETYHIDEDELFRQQCRIEANRNRAIRQAAREQEQQRRRKHRIRQAAGRELKAMGAAGAVALGWLLGLVDAAWAAPVMIVFLAAASWRAGKWYGGTRRYRDAGVRSGQ